jgi:hypothetical protein
MVVHAENRGIRGRLRAWTPLRALTAAGSPLVEARLTPGGPIRSQPDYLGNAAEPARPDSIRARSEEWQAKALLYAEAVPELAGAAALVRATMEGVSWVVEGGNDATRKRIQARVDAFDKERAAELIFLTGDAYIAVPNDPGSGTPVEDVEAPYSLSVAEIKVATDIGQKDQVKGPNGEWVDLVEEGSDRPIPFMRVWRKSKSNRWKGASPVKAAMDLLDAMYVAQMVDTATQNSRLVHAGIVFWPTNAPDIPVKAGEDPTPGSRQAMLAEFVNATDKKIDLINKGFDASKPFIVMYDPGKGGEATKYHPEMFRVEREDLAEQRATRVQTDQLRLATALELPVEAVTSQGTSGANRFSVHQIDVDKWKTWGSAFDKLIRVEFEKRMVKQYGKEYSLKTDSSNLVKKPDQTDVIVKLAQMEQVTPESAVQALKDASIDGLVAQKPPETGPKLNRAPGQPSDFGRGETDRGGGRFRDAP